MSLRSSILVAICGVGFAAACGGGGDDGNNPGVDASDPPAEGFRITTPDITIHAGEEVTYCYYTTIPTTRMMGIKRWSSTMSEGSHHLILFFAGSSSQPDGTIDQNCGIGGGGLNFPFWTYSAQTPTAEAVMPTGIGMTVAAGQKAYVQMHYVNLSEVDIQAHVQIDAEAYAATEQYTPAAAYVTYRQGFTVPVGGGETGGTCAVPAGAKFFTMSTHTHKQGTLTEVKDSASLVFSATNWEHPGARQWTADPFYTFASGSLTYHCVYSNTTGNPINEGQSAKTNEMCMAVGYFFPATAPKFCVNDFVLP